MSENDTQVCFVRQHKPVATGRVCAQSFLIHLSNGQCESDIANRTTRSICLDCTQWRFNLFAALKMIDSTVTLPLYASCLSVPRQAPSNGLGR